VEKLTGVGRVGKTRLATQTMATIVGEFPDGVWRRPKRIYEMCRHRSR
jgi:predicted ATPase